MTKQFESTVMLRLRISKVALKTLEDAATITNYRITQSSIVERGIELAREELIIRGVGKPQ